MMEDVRPSTSEIAKPMLDARISVSDLDNDEDKENSGSQDGEKRIQNIVNEPADKENGPGDQPSSSGEEDEEMEVDKNDAAEEDLEDEDGSEEDDEDSDENDEEGEDEEQEDEDEEDEDEEDEDEEEEDDEPQILINPVDLGSVWGVETPEEQAKRGRAEAEEANCLKLFAKAEAFFKAGRRKTARHYYRKCLKYPLIVAYTDPSHNWQRDRELFRDGIAPKTLHVYMEIVRKMVHLDPARALDYNLALLKIVPLDGRRWFSVGMQRIEMGDLELAREAFEKTSSREGIDALLSTDFLLGNYGSCLEMCEELREHDPRHKKARFIQRKILQADPAMRERFEISDLSPTESDEESFLEMEQRLENLRAKLKLSDAKASTSHQESLQPELIQLDVDEDMTLSGVLTLFCDLFDRIEDRSSLSTQKILLRPWWPCTLKGDVLDVVESILDTIECLDDAVEEVENRQDQATPHTSPKKPEYASPLKMMRQQRIRRQKRPRDANSDGEEAAEKSGEEEEEESEEDPEMFPSAVGFYSGHFRPLRRTLQRRPSRTPTPHELRPFEDDRLLEKIRLRLSADPAGHTIFEYLAESLRCLTEICPDEGFIDKDNRAVWIQCYRRFTTMSSTFHGEEWLPIHVLFFELGEPEAERYCVTYDLSNDTWSDVTLAFRFAWQTAKFGSEQERLKKLADLEHHLPSDLYIGTADRGFHLTDVVATKEAVERTNRCNSLQSLKQAGEHEKIVSVISKDVDFSHLELDDIFYLSEMWMESLRTLHQDEEAVHLATRIFALHRSVEPLLSSKLRELVFDLETIEWDHVSVDTKAALGYELSKLIECKEIVGWWPLWKFMYTIARAIEGPVTVPIVSKMLENGAGMDEVPSNALSVLVKAHEKLGDNQCCSQNKGEFLGFYMNELWSALSVPGIRELLLDDRNKWMRTNVHQETAQLLHCAFGRYTKKRKNLDEHGQPPKWEDKAKADILEAAIGLALPYPLPDYDDAEKLGHDVIDLITQRFPELMSISEEQRDVVTNFDAWLKVAELSETQPMIERSPFMSSIYYTLGLHHYKLNDDDHNDQAAKWMTLFLTSSGHTAHPHVIHGAWSVLAHTLVAQLFRLDDRAKLENWRYMLLPWRLAKKAKNEDGTTPFLHALSLYQLASRFGRLARSTKSADTRRNCLRDVEQIREEAVLALEQATDLPSHQRDTFLWVAFLLQAKLAWKTDRQKNLPKVLDSIYESACALQLSGSHYPAKISIKHQRNIEPVEVHYHMHSFVWKYLKGKVYTRENLIHCLAYLRAIQNHGVCRGSTPTLFAVGVDLQLLVHGMIDKVVAQEESTDVIGSVVDGMLSTVELTHELWNLCWSGFEVCTERFAHLKANYRLAEMSLERGNRSVAENRIFNGVFKRPTGNKEVNFLETATDISDKEISRSGSFCYHVARAVKLSFRISEASCDHARIVATCKALLKLTAVDEDSECLTRRDQQRLLARGWLSLRKAFDKLIDDPTSRPSWSKSMRLTVAGLCDALDGVVSKSKAKVVPWMYNRVMDLIKEEFGSIEAYLRDTVNRAAAQREKEKRQALAKAARRARAAYPASYAPPTKRVAYEDQVMLLAEAHLNGFQPSSGSQPSTSSSASASTSATLLADATATSSSALLAMCDKTIQAKQQPSTSAAKPLPVRAISAAVKPPSRPRTPIGSGNVELPWKIDDFNPRPSTEEWAKLQQARAIGTPLDLALKVWAENFGPASPQVPPKAKPPVRESSTTQPVSKSANPSATNGSTSSAAPGGSRVPPTSSINKPIVPQTQTSKPKPPSAPTGKSATDKPRINSKLIEQAENFFFNSENFLKLQQDHPKEAAGVRLFLTSEMYKMKSPETKFAALQQASAKIAERLAGGASTSTKTTSSSSASTSNGSTFRANTAPAQGNGQSSGIFARNSGAGTSTAQATPPNPTKPKIQKPKVQQGVTSMTGRPPFKKPPGRAPLPQGMQPAASSSTAAFQQFVDTIPSLPNTVGALAQSMRQGATAKQVKNPATSVRERYLQTISRMMPASINRPSTSTTSPAARPTAPAPQRAGSTPQNALGQKRTVQQMSAGAQSLYQIPNASNMTPEQLNAFLRQMCTSATPSTVVKKPRVDNPEVIDLE